VNDERARSILAPIISSFFIATLLQQISFAEDSGADFPPIISIDIVDGAIISDYSTVTIVIQNEEAPNSATWELFDSYGTRHFVDFTGDFDEGGASTDSQFSSWNEWSFEIEIEPLSIGPCSCIAKVSVEEEDGNPISTFTSIFISPDPSSDFQFPPTIQIVSDTSSHWFSKSHILRFVSMNADSGNSTFSYIVTQSSNVKCSNEYIEVASNSNILNPSQISQSDMTFSYNIDLNGLSDGWYDLSIFAINPSNQQHSYDCKSIRVDNNPPVVVIDGPDSITEGNGYAIFDGSSSYDESWGIQGLTYIWSVVKSDDIYENGTNVASGLDQRTFSVNTIDSGTYQIILTISDQAGNLGSAIKYLEVENVPPVVRLTIDGESISNNGEFTLSRESTCIIDASGSTDTLNDAENLRYVWRVNNIPTYEGVSREFSWPEGVDEDFILTIEVIDDDSESSQISILVKDGSAQSSIPLSIIVLILSTLFFSYSIVNMRKQANESDIPKW